MKYKKKLTFFFISISGAILIIAGVNINMPLIENSSNSSLTTMQSSQRPTKSLIKQDHSHTIVFNKSKNNPIKQKNNNIQLAQTANVETNIPINGTLQIDKNNHLIISYDIKLIFDQFLNIDEQKNEEAAEILLNQYLEKKLPPAALKDAKLLLSQYLQYRYEVTTIEHNILKSDRAYSSDHFDLKSIKRFFHEVQEMRKNIFDKKTVEIFFSMEEKQAIANIHLLEDTM